MNRKSQQRTKATHGARDDRQVVGRLERLIKRAPRPRKTESATVWARRHAAFVREWAAFCRENRTRLLRLDIDTNEIQILGVESSSLPHNLEGLPEPEDPRHSAAEEKDTLERLAKKPVRYQRLG
jgi:hypothetical protein